MYALVKFYDDIHYVCKSNKVVINKGIIKALYSDKRKYAATVLARNDNRTILKEIEQNINNGKPYIRCKRIQNKYVEGFENKIKVNKSVEKDDVQISLDINTRIRSAKENIHKEEPVAQSKSYEFLEKGDAQISLDMDTRTRFNDENIHEETAVQSKRCESLRKSDTENEITYNEKTVAQRKCSESLRNDDAQIILDTNTRIKSNENIHSEEVAQSKGCESLGKSEITLDIDTKIRSINENTYKKTAVQSKGCESLGRNDTEIVHNKETAAQRKCSESLRNNDAQIILDINRRLKSVDENIHSNEIAVQSEGCESLGRSDTDIAHNEETAAQRKCSESLRNDDAQIILGINTRLKSIDENIHSNEIAVQSKGCESLGKSDTDIAHNEETAAQRKCSESLRNEDAQIILGINTRLKSIDENIHSNEIAVQSEGCESLGRSDTDIAHNEETAAQRKCSESLRNDDAQIILGINTRLKSIDENIHSNEIVVQSEDCESLRNDSAEIALDIDTRIRSVNEITFKETVAERKGYESLENDEISLVLENSFVTATNFIDENGNNEERADTQSKNYNFLENSEILVALDMCYDVTSANLDYCAKKLNFSNIDLTDADLIDVCIPSIQSTTCDKENINPISSSEHSAILSPISTLHDVNDDNSSESEYLPSEDELRSLEHNEQTQQKKKLEILNTTVSSASSVDVSSGVDIFACNDENMYVEKSNTKSKQNYCCFCLKLQTQLSRHLETVHRNEPEVKKFAMLPKGNPERKKIIDIIRRNGNFKFNINSEVNNGKLIVCRRPNEKHNKSATDFIACGKCKGFFAKQTIRHHSRKCLKKDFSKNKCIMVMGRKVTRRIHHMANETLAKTVFPVMREDEITRIIRYDELLILYANKLCIKYKAQHQHDMIRARLRVLGRFLLALKKINSNIEDFKSLYHPKVYDDCISAINVVAGYDNEENMYKTPAVAANLSTLLKHIGNLLITEYIKTDDSEKKKLVKDFLKLLIVDIGTSVNKTVIETQSAYKRRKKINLPSMQDIQKLYKHLKKVREENYIALEKSFSYKNWISLAEATLTSIHVFNRRRAGEIERILIEDFKNYERINKNMYSDIYTSLSEENRKIAENYSRFCIRGKLGRTVPVLLTNELLKCIHIILKFRKEAEVSEKNPYLFGLRGCNKNRYRYLRACILMRKFSSECNAIESSSLRGTILRKHVATHCIQLNLNDIDVSDLATFMGHAEKIHREHYRQPLASRDILKISQYLEAVQGNEQDLNESSSDSEYEDGEDEKLEDENNNDIIMDKENVSLNTSSCNTSDDSITKKIQKNKRKRSTSPYGKTKRTRWTEKERETVLQAFATHMENLTLPSLREIQEIRKKYKCLSHRTSPQIKTWIHNKQKTLHANSKGKTLQ